MRLLGVGDNVVDCYPDLGRMFPGGNALNVAVAARRAGAETAYLGALGDDVAGASILRALQAEGVGTELVRVVHGCNARAWVRLIGGERLFMGSDRGVAGIVLDAADLDYARMFDVIHTGDCSHVEEQLGDLAETGCCISFDFSTRREPEYVRRILPFITVAWFSASDFAERETLRLLQAVVRSGPQLAVATRGSADILAHDGKHTWRQPIIAGLRVVDTLGAGDAFIGRFLVGFAGGDDIVTTLQVAAEAAGATCSNYGAFGYGVPLDVGLGGM